jgi:hypothetical protein
MDAIVMKVGVYMKLIVLIHSISKINQKNTYPVDYKKSGRLLLEKPRVAEMKLVMN